MKKSIILIIVVMLSILITIFIIINNETVDDAISKLTNSTEYIQMNDDEKKEAVEKLLKKLKAQGKIKYYLYSETSRIYSFEYSNGVLGGIMLKDFNPYMN